MTERRELPTVAGVMLALAVASTYPLVRQMASALPDNLGDPLLNTFILGWDADRIWHGFKGLWDAPFFFPMKDTLALSEHLLGVAIFTAPIQWITGNAVLAYNLAHLASYVLAGVGMYVLARSLWGRSDAAWVGALAFAFATHKAMHVSHLQMLMSGWMPIGLWGLHRYFEVGSRRALTVFVAGFALTALSNGYFLYFFAVPVMVVAASHLIQPIVLRRSGGPRHLLWASSHRMKQVFRHPRGSGGPVLDSRLRGNDGIAVTARGLGGLRRSFSSRPWWRVMAELAIAAVSILVILTPVAAAYLRVRHTYGFHRSINEMVHYSARAGDYLTIPPTLWIWSGHLREGAAERTLFPGLTVVLLAAVAATTWLPFAWPRSLVSRVGSSVTNSPERGARIARRETREYREYLSVEQRGEAGVPNAATALGWEAGCPARNMSANIRLGTLDRQVRRAWHVATYTLVLVLAYDLSFGPSGSALYRWCLGVVPGFDGLRVPARFVVVVALALAVLASAGAAWLFAHLHRRVAAALAVVAGLALVVESYPGAVHMASFGPYQWGLARTAYAWLAIGPPGAMLELPIVGPELAPVTLGYQLATLSHGHPIVNGYSGYGSALQDFFRESASPLDNAAGIAQGLQALRTLGVRYVVLHKMLYENQPDGILRDAYWLVEAINRADNQIAEHHRFGDVWVWRLVEPPLESDHRNAELVPLDPRTFSVSASVMTDRVRFAFDGRLDTRWLSGAPQSGHEWMRIAFPRIADVGRLRFLFDRYSTGDYPRHLIVEAEEEDGTRQVLFDGPVLSRLILGIAADGRTSPTTIDLRPNHTRVLWLKQTGQTRTWRWCMPELEILERPLRK
jgi:hypothetical protein